MKPAEDSLRGRGEEKPGLSRREFLLSSTLLTAATLAGCQTAPHAAGPEPLIDIHQHLGYSGRPDDVLLKHQRAMGVTQTILLPAGRNADTASTHGGVANGLQARCLGNQACCHFTHAHREEYFYGANEVPDLEDAVVELERYLELGAALIAEQKFGVDCDSARMQRIYEVAAEYRVPVLMHWQFGMYNYGFDRFYRMLEKHPRTVFIGHAQTWWANIDKKLSDPSALYPKGSVTPGGLTDRYLTNYPNLYGDLSAGSGLNALTRDEDFARDFLQRHQDRLLYGSDCSDWTGAGAACQGARTIAAVRRLAASKVIERKLLWGNAKHLFKL
jgi:predicted TIM-barrel fold metal-dependent hydrolase